MTIKEIYNELQMLDEFHANFNPNSKSTARMNELNSLLSITN
jgi:hypothetical protein